MRVFIYTISIPPSLSIFSPRRSSSRHTGSSGRDHKGRALRTNQCQMIQYSGHSLGVEVGEEAVETGQNTSGGREGPAKQESSQSKVSLFSFLHSTSLTCAFDNLYS
ncbi:unnamed protein product [Protopolystoma xenopodis]|uniref:Uncharacterized protein n=1 Tax=Protopolystoma xenopodis TaxID=117903 RepID=A0A448XBE8_9PLAT|nr:unnamed protein product [Protopolystoma xenopodis]